MNINIPEDSRVALIAIMKATEANKLWDLMNGFNCKDDMYDGQLMGKGKVERKRIDERKPVKDVPDIEKFAVEDHKHRDGDQVIRKPKPVKPTDRKPDGDRVIPKPKPVKPTDHKPDGDKVNPKPKPVKPTDRKPDGDKVIPKPKPVKPTDRKPDGDQDIPKPKPVKPTDSDVKDIGKFAVEKQNKQAGTQLEFVQVISGHKWKVTAGTIYELKIEAKDNKGTNSARALVFDAVTSHKQLIWLKN